MYNSLRKKFTGPATLTTRTQPTTLATATSKNNTRYKRKRSPQVFPRLKLLDLVATTILDPLPRTTNRNQRVIVISNRYSKLKHVTTTAKTTTTQVANVFFDYCVVPYGVPIYLLTDNGFQSVRKFFAAICKYLGAKNLTIAA